MSATPITLPAQTVPVFAPDGSLGDIPQERLADAIKHGYKPGVTMKSADGKTGIIPADRVQEAAKGGLQMVPLAEQETQHPGFWHTAASIIGGLAKAAPAMFETPGVNPGTGELTTGAAGRSQENVAAAAQADAERKARGESVPYRAAATAATLATPTNVPAMEQAAREGDMGAVAAHAAVPIALTAAPLAAEGVGALADKVPLPEIPMSKATAPLRAVVRGANTALAKYPKAVGSSVGATVGAMTHVPYGTEIGAGVGAAVGPEILPKIQIPGENVGLPKTVSGGPASAPSIDEFDAQAQPQPAATSPQTAATADTSPKNVERLLNDATGGKPLQKNVPLRNQATAATPKSSSLPADFTPEKSGELQGYKYDPASQHFEVIYNNGARVGRMGITPDQVAAFEDANSKGTAWNILKDSPGAINTKNGVPRAVPVSARSASPTDVAPGEEQPGTASPKPASQPAASAETARIYSTEYEGPDVDVAALEKIRDNPKLSQKVRDDARYVHQKIVDSGWNVKDAMDLDGTDALAKQLGGRMNKTINAESTSSAKPTRSASAETSEDDLTSLLQKSLEDVQLKKQGYVQTTADPAELSKRWGVDQESLANGREQTRGMSPEETEAYVQKLAERYKQGFPVEPVMETRDAANNIIEVDGRARAIAAQRAGVGRIPIIVRRMPK